MLVPYDTVGVPVWQNKSSFLGASYEISMSFGYARKGVECCKGRDCFDVVLVRRALFDRIQPRGILRNKTDSGIGLCEKNKVCQCFAAHCLPAV